MRSYEGIMSINMRGTCTTLCCIIPDLMRSYEGIVHMNMKGTCTIHG